MKINQDIAAFNFILGSLFLLISPNLLSHSIFCILCTLSVFIFLLCLFNLVRRYWLPYLFIVIGMVWSSHYAISQLNTVLPWVDKYITAEGYVDQLNVNQTNRIKKQSLFSFQKIRFQITHINTIPLKTSLAIELSWNERSHPILAGQRWCLTLMTQAIHSRLNDGSFNLQRFAASKHYFLRGKVKSAQLLNNTPTIRQKIVSKIARQLQSYPEAGMMIALLFGERIAISSSQKNVLLYAGIAHLMAISGLHVLLVATLTLRFFNFIQVCLPVSKRNPSFSYILSVLTSLCYVFLAGMNPPALRAFISFLGYVFLKLQKIEVGKFSLFLRLIALLIMYDPLLVLSDSFLLSCFAVLSLLFLYHWMPCPRLIHWRFLSPALGLLHLQVGIAFLLLPLQIILFNGISIGGLWVNLVAVPIMSCVIMPLLLLSLFFFCCHLSIMAHYCCFIADYSLSFILKIAESAIPFWLFTSFEYCVLSFSAWLGIIILRLRLWRTFMITVLLFFLLMVGPFFLKNNMIWRADMLDIGHGLAIVIRQGTDAIIYDSGQNYLYSSEAEKQIIPFLRWHNLHPTLLILSHQHSDHAGGYSILKKTYPNLKLMTSTSSMPNDFSCIKGKKWRWKALQLEVLWPETLATYAVNEHSCVIRISDSRHSLLLTGDLEKKQEKILLRNKSTIESTVLQMPHHGSNTSSTLAFIKQVNPLLTINSTARYNPWRLPSYNVMQRYKKANIPVLSTHEEGQITVYFYPRHWHYETYRKQIKPRWYHDWFGALNKSG